MKNAHMYTEQLAVAGCLSNKVFEQNCTEAFYRRTLLLVSLLMYISVWSSMDVGYNELA